MKPYGRPRRKYRANKKAKRQQQIKKIEQYFVSLLKCHAAMLQIQIYARSIRAKQDFQPGGIIGKVGDEFAVPGRGNINPLPNYIPRGEFSGSEYVVSVKPKFKCPPMKPGAKPLPADTPCDS